MPSSSNQIEVIGAGFGRTGTLSLKQALDELGYNCYHMREILKPENNFHSQLWLDAYNNSQSFDYDRIFAPQGYTATVDWPGAYFYHELMNQYPQSKVILTIRDSSESWFVSFYDAFYGTSFMGRLANLIRLYLHDDITRINNAIIGEGTFHKQGTKKDYAIKMYDAHIKQVQKLVPKHRLLVLNVKDGWKP
ncbi:unnamed protein product, partial [Didymodactylos carnosus]